MSRNSNLGIAPGAQSYGRFFNSISSARNEEAVPITGGTASERGSLGRDEPTSNGSEAGALKPHCFGIEVNECLAPKKKNRAEEGPTRFLRHTNISDTNRRTHQASRNRGAITVHDLRLKNRISSTDAPAAIGSFPVFHRRANKEPHWG